MLKPLREAGAFSAAMLGAGTLREPRPGLYFIEDEAAKKIPRPGSSFVALLAIFIAISFAASRIALAITAG